MKTKDTLWPILPLLFLCGCWQKSIEHQIAETSQRININWADTNAHLDMARLHEISGNREAALADLSIAIALGCRNPIVYVKRANLLFGVRSYDYATIDATSAMDLGWRTGMRQFRGMCYFFSRDYIRALEDFTSSRDSLSDSNWIADCHFILGEYRAALNYWICIRQKSRSESHCKEVMAAWCALGDYPMAFRYADSLETAGKQDSSEADYFRGVIHLQLGNPASATRDFQASVRKHVLEGLSEFYWAQACEQIGNHVAAAAHFDSSLAKGFSFIDLIGEESSLRATLMNASETHDLDSTSKTLQSIRTRNKILTQAEEQLAVERLAAIIPLKHHQDEVRSLFDMLITLENEQSELLLWETKHTFAP